MAIDPLTLFTPEAMAAVDRRAADAGLESFGLMERAGAAVAAAALRHWPALRRAVVLCGPGNNGGDGHVAARHLAEAGVPVLRCGLEPKPGGDAAMAFARFPGAIEPLDAYEPRKGDLVIDALFGAGMDRAVADDVAALISRIESADIPVLAVDLPSGLSGRTGRPPGACFRADRTVTFAARKPGHVLLPGRMLCGAVEVADIGIPARLIAADGAACVNGPHLYARHLPRPGAESHKYSRGHLVVFSGPLIKGGAARMAAIAGLRTGAGLVTLASPPGAVMAQAGHLTAVMQQAIAGEDQLRGWLDDKRLSAFVLGPGFGDARKARAYAAAIADAGRSLVLDADGLSAFSDRLDALKAVGAKAAALALTPHEGEFRRLFPDLAGDESLSKIDRARQAARVTGAVLVYKGADTVIAAPDGRVAVNCDAPPWLATAGAGDVLAGIVGGWLAQGMPGFEAACAGVALQGLAAQAAGPGMTAEDLIPAVSTAISRL